MFKYICAIVLVVLVVSLCDASIPRYNEVGRKWLYKNAANANHTHTWKVEEKITLPTFKAGTNGARVSVINSQGTNFDNYLEFVGDQDIYLHKLKYSAIIRGFDEIDYSPALLFYNDPPVNWKFSVNSTYTGAGRIISKDEVAYDGIVTKIGEMNILGQKYTNIFKLEIDGYNSLRNTTERRFYWWSPQVGAVKYIAGGQTFELAESDPIPSASNVISFNAVIVVLASIFSILSTLL